jgi:hypothetical protein
VQFLQVQAGDVAQFHVFEVVPPARVPRVEVRGVTGQLLDLGTPTGWTVQELRHQRTPVNRRAVPDHAQPGPGVAQQMEQELHPMQAVERFRADQDIHLPRRRQPAHDRQVIAGLPFVPNRRFSSGSVGSDLARQQVESRFVHETQGSALAACPGPPRWPDQAPPPVDGLLIPLDGPRDGNLRGPAQSLEDPRYLAVAVADAEFLWEYPGHSTTSPDVASEPVRLGTVPEDIRHPAPLLGGQPGRAAGDRSGQPGLGPLGAGRGQPPTDGRFTGTQGRRVVTRLPTQLAQPPSL